MSAIIRGTLPAQTAGGATSTTNLGTVPYVGGTNNHLRKVTLTAPVGMSTATANASDNVTVEIGRTRAGTRVVVASLTTDVAGGSIVASTPKSITVTEATVAASSVKPGDLFDCKLTQAGSGVALAAGCIVEVELD